MCPAYGLLEVPEVLWHHRAHGRMAREGGAMGEATHWACIGVRDTHGRRAQPLGPRTVAHQQHATSVHTNRAAHCNERVSKQLLVFTSP